MKKVLIFFLCTVLAVSMLGCSKKKEGKLSKGAVDIYNEIKSSDVLPEMLELDDEYISNYYGIDASKFDDHSFAIALASIQVDTVIIAQVKDEKDIEDMKSKIQNILDARATEMENYLPDMYNLVKKATVKTDGKVIYLVISEKADDIEKTIEKYIA